MSNFSSGIFLLDNKNGITATYHYKTRFNGFDCSFSGEGDINMKEQYFTILSKVYKMKEFNSGKTSKQYDDDFDIPISADYLHFLKKIIIFMSLLLF